MPGVLKGAQLGQHDAVPEVDVGAGRVDAELEPQRAPRFELLGEPALRQHVHGAAKQGSSVAASEAVSGGGDVTGPMLDSAPG